MGASRSHRFSLYAFSKCMCIESEVSATENDYLDVRQGECGVVYYAECARTYIERMQSLRGMSLKIRKKDYKISNFAVLLV